jgi:hypothetical protein
MLRFDACIAEPFVKPVSGFAYHVGTQDNRAQAFSSRPFFRGFYQALAHTGTAPVCSHYQADDFRDAVLTHRQMFVHMHPPDNAVFIFRHAYRMHAILQHGAQPHERLLGARRIAELRGKVGDACCVGKCRIADPQVSGGGVGHGGQKSFSESRRMVTGPSLINSRAIIA